MIVTFLIGAFLGAITGVPIGPVNVAVIDTAYRHTLRRAVAVGIGGAVADGIYAGLGILVMGPLLEANPGVPPVLYALSGLVLFVYGIRTARTQPITVVTEPKERDAHPSAKMWPGFLLGLSLIILNPAAILTWVVIIGPHMADSSNAQGYAASIGVSCGSFLWFAFVAYLANHGKKLLGGKAVWMTRVVGLLLTAYGLFSIGRAFYLWLR